MHQQRHIPTLDGWRGIAILMVIITHAYGGITGHTFQTPWLNFGQHGVTLFFVLSGYLITTKLLSEDRMNLRAFYTRRFFRLMPVAWVYFGCVSLIGLAIKQHIIGSDIVSCLFFVRNYVNENDVNVMTEHFWSLSLEEQFYLIWPLVLLLSRRWALLVAIGGALGCALFRFLHWSAYDAVFLNLHSSVRVDALLVGCTLAFALRKPPIASWVKSHAGILFGIGTAVFLHCIYRFQLLLPLYESVALACLIAASSSAPNSWFGRILEYPHLAFVGKISYSLYVWQQVLIVPRWCPVGIFFLPCVAVCSYAFIERPCVALGRRLQRGLAPESGGRKLPGENSRAYAG